MRKSPFCNSGCQKNVVKLLRKLKDCILVLLEDRTTLLSCQKLTQCQALQLRIIWHHSGHGWWEIMGYCWRNSWYPSFLSLLVAARMVIIILPHHHV